MESAQRGGEWIVLVSRPQTLTSTAVLVGGGREPPELAVQIGQQQITKPQEQGGSRNGIVTQKSFSES